jgi:hypothetical protein
MKASKPVRGQRAAKNKSNKSKKKTVAMSGGNGKKRNA